jgi:hypothetical protein
MSQLDDLLGIDPATTARVAGPTVVIYDGPVRTPQDEWDPADRPRLVVDEDGDGW